MISSGIGSGYPIHFLMVGNSTKTVRKWTSLAFSNSFVIYPYRYWPKNSSQVLKGSWSLKGVCNLWSQWRKRFLKIFYGHISCLENEIPPTDWCIIKIQKKKMLDFLLNKEYVSFEAYDNFLSLFLQISPFCL